MTRIRILLAIGSLALLVAGAALGILFAAPHLADWRNDCVAERVITESGADGPRVTVDPADDPRSRWTAPPSWTTSRAPQATPKAVP